MLSALSISQLQDSRKGIPRYLFRTYSSDGSQGHNSPTLFKSEATSKTVNHISLYDIPEGEAKELLEKHFLWHYSPEDEFISWTSSLLWALQHAIRKQDYYGQRDTCICVLDTSNLSKACIYPATTLLRVYKISSEGKLQHEYYNAEYLAHSTVRCANNQAVAVPLQALINHGLYGLLPELNDAQSKGYLYSRIKELRSIFFTQDSTISAQDIAIAKRLAYSFGGPWTLPALLVFLTLRKRPMRNATLLSEVREHFSVVKLPRVSNLIPGIPEPPEVSQFWKLVKDICEDREQRNWQFPSVNEAHNNVELSELLGELSLGNTEPTLVQSKATSIGSGSYKPYNQAWDTSERDDVGYGDGFGDAMDDDRYEDEFGDDTDDEVEEANMNDDIIKMMEG
ncbi:MAG: hypothetical protein Q9163_001865 [Psora crenata]